MTKKHKAYYILEELEKLYPTTPVPLDHTSKYTLLIAVLLSAQCTDERVNKITPILFSKADNPFEMVKMKIEDIQQIIRPCGLSPKKAYAIFTLSQILIDKYNGEVPENIDLLEELPGVGHKTASVVMSQGFGHPMFPVDTHIHRLLTRWGITSGKNVIETEKDAKKIFPKQSWNKLHLQIIFYGREYSPARSPKLAKDFITKTIGTKKAISELI
jgi:endonuclease-3